MTSEITPSLRLLNERIFLLLACFSFPGFLLSQACDECVYYDVMHLSRVEDHPVLGSWDELWTLCIPPDEGRDFRVTADGSTASKFEISLIVLSNCTYENTDPVVEFVDDENNPIQDPTPEEYGVITITEMTETTVSFEYTHPTNPPGNGMKFREVRIGISDYSPVTNEYSPVCWMVINIYRPPVLMVHGLWSNGIDCFGAMLEDFANTNYEDQMVAASNYPGTNGHSFSTNADVVPVGIDFLVNQCRSSFMSAGKVDLVGHSMGGILSRLYLQGSYRNDVYRVVTCNTPHSGSQAANFLLDPFWAPYNTRICDILGALKMPCGNGAIADLAVDSAAITALNNGVHPPGVGVHALMTTRDSPLPSVPEVVIMTKIALMGFLVHLSNSCGGMLMDTLYQGDVHDWVVAGESQKGGLVGPHITLVTDQEHMGSTGNPAVIMEVRQLLSEPGNSPKFTPDGFSPPDLTYSNMLSCAPFMTGGGNSASRSVSSTLSFVTDPAEQAWMAGDTAMIAVTGSEVDTVVLLFELNGEEVLVQKHAGPEATFTFVIPEYQAGQAAIVAFGYNAAQQLLTSVGSTMDIDPQYSLTGISVFPTKIYSNIGDTTDFQVIGHYDDGVDRVLNGDPGLVFTFTTWSASPTSDDDILLNFGLNDTLIVSIDTFTSAMVKIYYSSNPSGPVNWLGGTGNWNDDGKWDIGCAPGPGNTVYISSGECTIPPLIHAQARAVEITSAALVIDGQLTIDNSLSTGMNINKSWVENHGLLEITNVGSNTALWLQGVPSDSAFFMNAGDVVIHGCSGTFGVSISLHTLFQNEPGGSFSVTDCGSLRALDIGSGSLENFMNHGLVAIDGGSVGGVGRILNTGIFRIDHTIPATYGGLDCAYFENTASGLLQVRNTYLRAIQMDFQTDSLVNAGTVDICCTTDDGIYVANTYNTGNMFFDSIPNEAILMDGSGFKFDNMPAGWVRIANAGIGIYIRNTGSRFNNLGILEIDSLTSHGIYVRSSGKFINDTSGVVHLQDIGGRGIYVLDNTATVAENFGEISIAGSTDHGVFASNDGAFHNRAGGDLHLAGMGQSALATGGLFGGNTILTNAGRITIQLPVALWGIDHGKRFTNEACGIIDSEAPFRSAAANFINHGGMHLRNTAPHSVTSPGNKLVNNGWIEDVEGLVNLSTQVTNQGIIARPVSYSGCSGDTLLDFFALGSLSGFTISQGYTDIDLTTQAGFLDTMNNTFAPDTAGILSPAWFFTITDDGNGCTDTFSVRAITPCPVNCSGDPFLWTGCVSTDWTDGINWNRGSVPTALDAVLIHGAPAGSIFPEILTSVQVGQLELKPGAFITLRDGVIFHIQE